MIDTTLLASYGTFRTHRPHWEHRMHRAQHTHAASTPISPPAVSAPTGRGIVPSIAASSKTFLAFVAPGVVPSQHAVKPTGSPAHAGLADPRAYGQHCEPCEPSRPRHWSRDVLPIIGAAVGAYHGYKRHEIRGNPLAWAVAWGFAGHVAPLLTAPVALAQGIDKALPKNDAGDGT